MNFLKSIWVIWNFLFCLLIDLFCKKFFISLNCLSPFSHKKRHSQSAGLPLTSVLTFPVYGSYGASGLALKSV